MDVESDLSRIRDGDVVQGPQVRDQDHGHDLDLVAVPAPAQGVAVVLAAVVVAVAVPNQEHILNQNRNPNPNHLNVAELDLNPNQETAQSRNLSQSPNPDLVLGPRLRGQSPGHSPNLKLSLLQKIDLAAKDREVTYRDLDQAVNIAKAVAVLVHQ